MSDFNPYAAPQLFDVMKPMQGSDGGVWRQGNVLIMHKLARLPDRCVKSNEPATRQLKRKLSWHHPAVYFAILANLIIYAILALVLSKKATIYVGLSDHWFLRRRLAIVIGWLVGLGGLALVVGGIGYAGDYAALAVLIGLVFMLGGALYGAIGARMVYAKKIDDQFVWLGGVHRDYLDMLPTWPY